MGHRNIADIRGPHLIGPRNGQIPEQVRIHGMAPMHLRRPGLAREGFDTHPFHQRSHVCAPHAEALQS